MLKEKIGYYGGKFCPFHEGHLFSIVRAASMVDHLYVVVSYIEERDMKLCEDAGLPYIHYKQRALWIRQETKHLGNVTVLYVEDVPFSYKGKEYAWVEGQKRVIEKVDKKITHIFSSESEYEYWFKKIFGEEIEHIIIDEARDLFPISATKIRNEGVYANWDMIPKSCRPFYTKKIAFVGVESTGKTTLVKNLANLFNTTYAIEYGRILSEELGNGSDLLTEEHYKRIVYGHKYLEYEELKKANKVFFIDSEAIVTQYYAKMYQGEEYEFVESVIKTQDYDLYILLKPDVKWVADGLRTVGDMKRRNETNEILKNMFKERNIPFVEIGGDYDERLQESVKLVTNFLKKKNG